MVSIKPFIVAIFAVVLLGLAVVVLDLLALVGGLCILCTNCVTGPH